MEELLYIRIDGDNIGDSIELALLNKDWILAQKVHNEVQEGIKQLVNFVKSFVGTKVLLVGCDDILFTINVESYDILILKKMQKNFLEATGFTISIGVGFNLLESIYNLKKAKLSGKNIIIS